MSESGSLINDTADKFMNSINKMAETIEGIKMGTISLNYTTITYFGLGFFCFVWICIVIWGIKDITNRTNSLLFQLICIFIIVIGTPFMFSGVFLYLLIRPSRTILEKSFDNIELIPDYMELPGRNGYNKETGVCKKCGYSKIMPEFKKCPECGNDLKIFCRRCKKEVNLEWRVCPFCEERIKNSIKENKKNKNKKGKIIEILKENSEKISQIDQKIEQKLEVKQEREVNEEKQ